MQIHHFDSHHNKLFWCVTELLRLLGKWFNIFAYLRTDFASIHVYWISDELEKS